MIPGL